MTKKKLLIADDEPDIRSLVRMTLTSHKFEIIEASDGIEALKMVKQEFPDLVLLDVTMPGMTGFEVCQEIRSDPALSSTVVVMLTALAQESDLKVGEEAGADGYFTKPFSPLALMRRVDEILGE